MSSASSTTATPFSQGASASLRASYCAAGVHRSRLGRAPRVIRDERGDDLSPSESVRQPHDEASTPQTRVRSALRRWRRVPSRADHAVGSPAPRPRRAQRRRCAATAAHDAASHPDLAYSPAGAPASCSGWPSPAGPRRGRERPGDPAGAVGSRPSRASTPPSCPTRDGGQADRFIPSAGPQVIVVVSPISGRNSLTERTGPLSAALESRRGRANCKSQQHHQIR